MGSESRNHGMHLVRVLLLICPYAFIIDSAFMFGHKRIILLLNIGFIHLLFQGIQVLLLALLSLFLGHFIPLALIHHPNLDILSIPLILHLLHLLRCVLLHHLVVQALFIHVFSSELLPQLIILTPLSQSVLLLHCFQVHFFVFLSLRVDVTAV